MTKKAKILISVSDMLDILDNEDFNEVRPFIQINLERIKRRIKGLRYESDLMAFVDGALAFSDTKESLGYALDELYNALICL